MRRLARKYFQLTLPTTIEQLKSAFRREALLCHPDMGGNRTDFVKLKQAYDVLCSRSEIFDIPVEMATDGTPLSELGIGVKTGEACPSCAGKGYLSIHTDPWMPCPSCRGTGAAVVCPFCKDSFFKRACWFCKGKGILGVESAATTVLQKNNITCPTCRGSGGYRGSVYRHYRCDKCKGTGQSETSIRNVLTTKVSPEL